ncbi:replication stress response regulator SDE2 [Impatiens glandulifera]|uniref:replication stress response regulator SDE2 n=1 Tax=Impatiens glandulifera TaxID=253017 RepID=UPI001FB17DC7|nr:replication stress response regulator SDE2 [Impatiens glandulifera]
MADLSYNLFARLLDGTTRNLLISSPSVAIHDIKNRIQEISGIPIHNQRLVSGGLHLDDDSVLEAYEDSNDYPTLHLVLRLPGGKGGFGSLLRGAATKAGQKKTSNFDACRDMSGRRLRHVNAEKKLEEWKADAEQRKLEKVAEDYIKKNTKAAKKGGGSGGTDKYVEKYRQDSAKCMEKVEKSVRESLLSSKRKIGGDKISKSDAKRVKIWMGKRKMGDSESEDSDDSDREEEENVKSVVLDNEKNSDSDKEIGGSSVSVTGGELTYGPSSGCNSDEEKRSVSLNQSEDSSDEQVLSKTENQVVHDEDTVVLGDATVSRTEGFETEKVELDKDEPSLAGKNVDQPSNIASSLNVNASECKNVDDSSTPLALNDSMVLKDAALDVKPLNLNEVNSASELEVCSHELFSYLDSYSDENYERMVFPSETMWYLTFLIRMQVFGLERLKSELQANGLKCGGTLKERASRLFLLKTTPLEKIPKKLLAKN